MRAWALTALSLLALAGCGGDDQEIDPSQVTRTLAPPPAPPAPVEAPKPEAAKPPPRFSEPFPFEQQPNPAEQPAAAQAGQDPAQKPKERNYSAELLAQLNGSQSCVQPRPATETLPAESPVSVEAHVLESGMITRGYVRSSFLTPDELKCIERRVESARLPPDVKEAPRRVDTTIKLTFPRAPVAAAAPAPAAPAPAAGY